MDFLCVFLSLLVRIACEFGPKVDRFLNVSGMMDLSKIDIEGGGTYTTRRMTRPMIWSLESCHMRRICRSEWL